MDIEKEKIWFETTLFPQRSLGQKGFRVLMIAIVSLSFFSGLLFFKIGAWPISGFFGLDVLLIYVAFKVHYQHGNASENIRLVGDKLTITRIDHKGERQSFIYSSYWVNVAMAVPSNVPKHLGETYIEARSHGKGTFFGTYLTQENRVKLMNAIRQALVNSKNYRLT